MIFFLKYLVVCNFFLYFCFRKVVSKIAACKIKSFEKRVNIDKSGTKKV